MAIEEGLRILAERVRSHSSSMLTEEAVKTAVVLPFLNALGYDVFNPAEVIPEFVADAVGKKGEKARLCRAGGWDRQAPHRGQAHLCRS